MPDLIRIHQHQIKTPLLQIAPVILSLHQAANNFRAKCGLNRLIWIAGQTNNDDIDGSSFMSDRVCVLRALSIQTILPVVNFIGIAVKILVPKESLIKSILAQTLTLRVKYI